MGFILQHPGITHALECGEDIEQPKCFCDRCHQEIYYGESSYTAEDGRIFCPECMKEELKDLGLDYIAEALGFEVNNT